MLVFINVWNVESFNVLYVFETPVDFFEPLSVILVIKQELQKNEK